LALRDLPHFTLHNQTKQLTPNLSVFRLCGGRHGWEKKKGSSTWADANFDHVELEPRAHAKKLLKITQQWKATADEGGIPPHDRFVEFLDAVTSLTTKMRDRPHI
jgi:hypothetical protein